GAAGGESSAASGRGCCGGGGARALASGAWHRRGGGVTTIAELEAIADERGIDLESVHSVRCEGCGASASMPRARALGLAPQLDCRSEDAAIRFRRGRATSILEPIVTTVRRMAMRRVTRLPAGWHKPSLRQRDLNQDWLDDYHGQLGQW